MVHACPPLPRPGSTPFSRARSTFVQRTAVGALVFVLALVGLPVFRAANALRLRAARSLQARRRREDDRRLWEIACADRRVMSDLVALRQQSPACASDYF
jgi:hypothetical protein